MYLEDANDVMLDSYETTIEPLPDVGQIRVGISRPLEGITGEMFEWWFGQMDAETYTLWNPGAHKEFAWVEGWEPGRYVGATHLTHQTLNLPDGSEHLMRAHFSFVPRALWLDWRLFAERGVTGAVCGIVRPLDDEGAPRDVIGARMIHVCLGRDYGSELHSSFWFTAGNGAFNEDLAKGFMEHLEVEHDEIVKFLPKLYAGRR